MRINKEQIYYEVRILIHTDAEKDICICAEIICNSLVLTTGTIVGFDQQKKVQTPPQILFPMLKKLLSTCSYFDSSLVRDSVQKWWMRLVAQLCICFFVDLIEKEQTMLVILMLA